MKHFKLSLILLVFSFVLFSCSKDEDSNSGTGILKLSGTVMSPNHGFPISRAKVKVFKSGEMISEQTTDALGTFLIDHLPSGDITVELSKGKFKKEIILDLEQDYSLRLGEGDLNIFPKIAVVRGAYDEIEQVLVNIGVVNPVTNEPAFDIVSGSMYDSRESASAHASHGGGVAARNTNSLPANVSFNFDTLLHDTTLLNSYDIIFLNCGGKETYAADTVAMDNLKAFIENGGIVYATDWMYKYLQAMFPANDYLAFSAPEKKGNSLTADVQVLNTDLTTWLANQGINVNPSLEINGFLPAWQMVDTFNTANVDEWLTASNVTYNNVSVPNKSLAFTFQYGQGGVFYSSFHTHGNNSSEDTILQMMYYFIFELSELAV